MYSKKQKYSAVLIFILSIVTLTGFTNFNYFVKSPDYIFGKVIFSDNRSTVNTGFVKVFKSENKDTEYNFLQIAAIDQNGVFKLNRNVVSETDGIKIMAYVNDVENMVNEFEPKVMDIKEALSVNGERYEMLIIVERNKKQNK